MNDCASILDSIAKGFLVSMNFCIVHPIPTSPFIQLNDFCTCVYSFMVITATMHLLHMYTGFSPGFHEGVWPITRGQRVSLVLERVRLRNA